MYLHAIHCTKSYTRHHVSWPRRTAALHLPQRFQELRRLHVSHEVRRLLGVDMSHERRQLVSQQFEILGGLLQQPGASCFRPFQHVFRMILASSSLISACLLALGRVPDHRAICFEVLVTEDVHQSGQLLSIHGAKQLEGHLIDV